MEAAEQGGGPVLEGGHQAGSGSGPGSLHLCGHLPAHIRVSSHRKAGGREAPAQGTCTPTARTAVLMGRSSQTRHPASYEQGSGDSGIKCNDSSSHGRKQAHAAPNTTPAKTLMGRQWVQPVHSPPAPESGQTPHGGQHTRAQEGEPMTSAAQPSSEAPVPLTSAQPQPDQLRLPAQDGPARTSSSAMVTIPSWLASISSSNSLFLSRTQLSSTSWPCWFSTVPTGREMNSDSESFLSPSWSVGQEGRCQTPVGTGPPRPLGRNSTNRALPPGFQSVVSRVTENSEHTVPQATQSRTSPG